MSSFFIELSLVLFISLILSLIMTKFKQPLLIGYIITGILSGPLFFNILSSNVGYETFSHLGVALLLFIVGLHLNLKLIKEIGSLSLITGSIQIFLTSFFGFLISYLFSFDFISSLIIGIGIAFSSTIVIVKLLTDAKEIDKIQGKLSIGILIVQDLAAIIFLMVLTSIKETGINSNLFYSIFIIFLKGFFLLILILIFSKFVLDKILDFIAKSQDLLFVFIISWVLIVSALFTYLGFSIEIGALLAGIALASSPYQFEISSKVKPLRDFFIIMFFILLGSQMIPITETINHVDVLGNGFNFNLFSILYENFKNSFIYMFHNFSSIFFPAIILSLFVIIVKPIIVFMLFNIFGFHNKVSFKSAISLSQISEFSMIIALFANSLNLIDSKIVSLITLIAIITITISTYLITHSNIIFNKINFLLKIIQIRKNPKINIEKNIQKYNNIIIFGYDRIGYSLLNSIKNIGKNYLIVDYNPEIIKKLDELNEPCLYGDANDSELINEFDISSIELIISTIPELETSLNILKRFKKLNHKIIIILTALKIDDALELYEGGADYVVLPHFLGGDYISNLIETKKNNFQELLIEKVKHISQLKERKKFGHEHPRN